MELPLFPLNTVLFPGIPLRLHIFEPRYKAMVRHCLDKDQAFGVVLIAEGVEANGPLAQPHLVGCTARIVQMEPLADGRMNIVALGQERFQVRSLRHDQPYLVGDVELYPMASENPAALMAAARRLRPLLARYLEILSAAGVLDFDVDQLPDDPLELGYLGAALLQVSIEQKQALLSIERASTFLEHMSALYRQEVALLASMPRFEDQAGPGAFSLN